MSFPFKILFVLTFSLVSCYHAYSQEQQHEAVDSLGYYEHKIDFPDSNNDLLKAFVFFRNEKAESLNKPDTLKAVFCLRQLSKAQRKLGALYDSEKSAVEALNLLEHLPENDDNKYSKAAVYNHLGRLYREKQNFEKAIAYHKKALTLVDNIKYEIALRNNIAYAELKRNNISVAKEAFAKLYQDGLVLNDSIVTARALDNLGLAKGKLQDTSGVSDLQKALDMRLSLGINSHIVGSYHDFSEYYKDQGNLEKAKRYAEKAYSQAKKSNNPSELLHVLRILISLNDDEAVRTYGAMVDSMKTVNLSVDEKYASKKYDLEKEKALAYERLLELEKEKSLKFFYASLALVLLSLSVFVVVVQRHRHHKKQQLEVYHTELRISKKVHDEVANDVYHIMNKLQHEGVGREAILDHLEAVYDKTRDISREHQEINVVENFQEILLDLIRYYENNQVNIITKDISKVDWNLLESHKKVAVYRVLQELFTNMKKHSQATLVVLSFKQNGAKIHINYKDNGIGCELKIQNGLQNTENRIKSIKGSIIFKSEINKGFQASIIV